MEDYPRRVSDVPEQAPPPVPVRPRVKTGMAWATDLCTVNDCRDGFVSREIKGYSVLFGCPVCDRWKMNVFPDTAIPTLKRWPGAYEVYEEEEMDTRLADRISVVESIREQARRRVQFDHIDESISNE